MVWRRGGKVATLGAIPVNLKRLTANHDPEKECPGANRLMVVVVVGERGDQCVEAAGRRFHSKIFPWVS